MKILFVTEYFAPDSVIGAVRITKLAKYLSKSGNNVSVICAAHAKRKEDVASLKELDGIRIRRFGEKPNTSQMSEKHKKKGASVKSGMRLLNILPYPLYTFCNRVYRKLIFPIKYYKDAMYNYRHIMQYFEDHWKNERFDVVFATYSTLASICAGKSISEQTGAKLVVDLRDLMNSHTLPLAVRAVNKQIQNRLVSNANIVLHPSAAGTKQLKIMYPEAQNKIYTLYNGYDEKCIDTENRKNSNELVLAYTGDLYSGKRDFSPLFKAIKVLQQEHKYEIRFLYAGVEAKELYRQAAKYELEKIIENFGEVSRYEAEAIQNKADIFLVATWNTEKEQGILTGKFYEGIRAEKQILVLVSGNRPDSELYQFNQKYNYGFCYEACRSDSFEDLCKYLRRICIEKREKNFVEYHQNKEMENKFHYKNLAEDLESLLRSFCLED